MSDWREHDVRLVPAAVLVWAATLFGELGWDAGLGALSIAGMLAATVALGRCRRDRARRGVLLLVGLSCVAGVLAGVLSGLRLHERDSSALAAAARADGHVRLDGTAASRPRPVGDGRLVVVELQVDVVTFRGADIEVGLRAVVMGQRTQWAGVVPGTAVTVSGTAHTPSNASSIVALVVQSAPPRLVESAPRWSVLAQHVRDGLREAAAVNEPDVAGLLVALVDGDTAGISDLTTQEFRRSGLAHLLAVSGANVAIVTGAVLWLLRLVRAPFAIQLAGAAAALAAFMAVTGAEPSVLRAGAMGVVMLIALASGRPRAAIPALCSAVIVLLVWLPDLATSIGFVLSVLATAGVVVLGGYWSARLRERMPMWLAASIAVASAAAVATLPVIVLLLPLLNVGSVLANIVAAPAVPVATICGVLAAASAPVLLPVAQALCFVAGYCVRWIATVARIAAEPGPFQVPLPTGAMAAMIAAAGVGAVVLVLRLTRGRPVARSFAAAVVLGVVVLSIPVRAMVSRWPPNDWLFAACDVGQGDAVLARAGPGSAVLLDAGPDPAALDDCLSRLDIEELRLVVLTHFHDDHIAGIPAVLGRRPVGGLAVGTFDGGPAEQTVRRLAASAGVQVVEVGDGWRYTAGEVRLEVVGPREAIYGTTSDPNNNSLVVRATVHGVTLLATGDLQSEAEAALLDCGCLRADILKVPHHGSKNRDDAFFAATGARLALISVGADNDYGHPAPSTLTELTRLGMMIRRTDRDGTVLVVPASEGGIAVR